MKRRAAGGRRRSFCQVSDPLYSFEHFVEMIGFPKVWDFEKEYADLLAAD